LRALHDPFRSGRISLMAGKIHAAAPEKHSLDIKNMSYINNLVAILASLPAADLRP
jgi:hypothetical protein